MKACLTVICVVGLASTLVAAESPIDKGSVILGGQISLQSFSGDAYGCGPTVLALSPQVSAFVTPGFALGIEGSLAMVSGCGDTDLEFHVGPRVAYYFCSGGYLGAGNGSALPYVAGLASYGSYDPGYDNTADVVKFGGEAGVVYMASDAVGIDTGVRVTSDHYNWGDGWNQGLTLTASVGLKAFLF